MGYRNGTITMELDDWYTHFPTYMKAVQKELERQGRDVTYQGDGEFLIDGKRYILIERHTTMSGIPMQRTILEPEKD
ncbi:hypothetical protein [Lentibacillus sp.]|uniref:hypothetical protein n=1 Tax=Lentibacillus sp. TaxID=1925746 RepID=UPI002B4B74E9|nr:hypothetical protein [Lentibacillus sp.]HLS10026.1 hypothetical protein [Lentibacillus sp.]